MGHKNKALAAVMVLGILMGGCGLGDDDDDDNGLPGGGLESSAPATGTALVVGTVEASEVFINTLLSLFEPPAPKPSASGQKAAITPQQLPPVVDCGSGGDITITPVSATEFTAVANNCADEDFVLVDLIIDGSYTGVLDPICFLPTDISGTVNGTMTIDGVDTTLTNFGADVTNIVYGPQCDLIDGSFSVDLTGSLENDLVELDFGTSTLSLLVIDIQDLFTTFSVDGDLTVGTECDSGSVMLTTDIPITVFEDDTCPATGQVTMTGDFGTEVLTFDGSCDLLVCTFEGFEF